MEASFDLRRSTRVAGTTKSLAVATATKATPAASGRHAVDSRYAEWEGESGPVPSRASRRSGKRACTKVDEDSAVPRAQGKRYVSSQDKPAASYEEPPGTPEAKRVKQQAGGVTASAMPSPAKRPRKAQLRQNPEPMQTDNGVNLSVTVAESGPAASSHSTLLPPPAPCILRSSDDINKALEHLSQADPRLAQLIRDHPLQPEKLLAKDTSPFSTLAHSIACQQLSDKAAATIYARVLEVCKAPSRTALRPADVLAADVASLRTAGLSDRKAQYMRGLAEAFSPGGALHGVELSSLEYCELHSRLTALKGIGPWTVHMLAMFHLGRADVLPVGDLGVRRGVALINGLMVLPDEARMEELTAAWRPYRSVGSYFMWKIPPPAKALPEAAASKGKSKSKG